MTSFSFVRSALLTAACLVMLGCGDGGPKKYPVAGKVTFGGKPIIYGDIRFEPKEGLNNQQTMAFSQINDGNFATEVVGGPHWVYVRDLTGDADMGNPEKPGRSMFKMEYRDGIDLPKVEDVESGKPVEQDVTIPTSHK